MRYNDHPVDSCDFGKCCPDGVGSLTFSSRCDTRGAPFWRLVEFVDGVPERVRDQVEAALHGAGLLDAWVTPDGAALRLDTLDTFLRADGTAAHGANLLAVLRPAESSEVARQVVRDLLAAVGFLDRGDVDVDGPWVSADGGWSIGPLTGRTEGGAARHIGVAAREAARRRALADLDRRIGELVRRIAELDADAAFLATTAGRLIRISREALRCILAHASLRSRHGRPTSRASCWCRVRAGHWAAGSCTGVAMRLRSSL